MGQAWVPVKLPDFQVTKVIHSVEHIDIYAQSTIKKDQCPACNVASTKVHGSYERHLRDLPCQICSITLHIRVRRFVCLNTKCPRQTFTEDTSRLAPHFARRTSRLTNWLKRIALALGGEAGAAVPGLITIVKMIVDATISQKQWKRKLAADLAQFRYERVNEDADKQRETQYLLQEHRSELLYLASFELSDSDLQLLIDRLLDLMMDDQNENSRLIVSTFISRIDIEPGDPVNGKIHYTFPSPNLVQSQGLSAKRVKPSDVKPCLLPLAVVSFSRPKTYAAR